MIHPALLSLPLLVASLPLPAKGTQDQTPPTPPPFEAPPDVAPDVEGGVFTRFYHESGALAREGFLLDGARSGVWKAWDEGGARQYHGAFRGYRRVGPWIIYGKGARSTTKGNYDDDGLRDGVWAIYGNRGDLRMRAVYRHGLLDGQLERFTRGGKVVEEGQAAELFKNPKTDYTRALFAAAFRLETAGNWAAAT